MRRFPARAETGDQARIARGFIQLLHDCAGERSDGFPGGGVVVGRELGSAGRATVQGEKRTVKSFPAFGVLFGSRGSLPQLKALLEVNSGEPRACRLVRGRGGAHAPGGLAVGFPPAERGNVPLESAREHARRLPGLLRRPRPGSIVRYGTPPSAETLCARRDQGRRLRYPLAGPRRGRDGDGADQQAQKPCAPTGPSRLEPAS